MEQKEWDWELFQSRVAKSEFAFEWINPSLMAENIWSLKELGYSFEECRISGSSNLYFHGFSLPWLKLLAKLTAFSTALERNSISLVVIRVNCLKHLDQFLVIRGYTHPQLLTDSLLQEFIAETNSSHRQATMSYAVKLWASEGWLRVTFTPRKYNKATPKIEIIPEEVLHQIYEKFDLFPAPLERLFRLQLVLGCRIGEMLTMPRQCLKVESDQWFLLRWIEKLKQWKFYQVHTSVAELVIEQQRFLDTQFGKDSDFNKLFCHVSAFSASCIGFVKRFQADINYTPEILSKNLIQDWLKDFREVADLKDKYGRRFNLTSHMFRRTKASIMAYCEAEDEYIAAVLGHASLDMLPHYRQRSLERLEKEAQTKGYVDMYGRITTFKPKKQRYEKLVEILKVSTPLGECHRPTMLGDCQYRYACLNCDHHRLTLEDKPKLEADIKNLLIDLEKAQTASLTKRVTEIQHLLELLNKRLIGLNELQNIKGDKTDEQA